MSFSEKIKQPVFWSNFIKVALPFFIIVTLISLFLNSWADIFAGNFTSVSDLNFSNGKWVTFFGIKIVVSVIYGLYVTNKNTKK